MDTFRATNNFELGRALALMRLQLGKTQEEIAPLIGSQRSHLSKMENGLATEQLIKIFLLLREYGYEINLVPKSNFAL